MRNKGENKDENKRDRETENANTKFVNTCSVGVSRMRKCRDMITWSYRRGWKASTLLWKSTGGNIAFANTQPKRTREKKT